MTNQTTSQNTNGDVRLTDFHSMTLQEVMSSEISRPEWLVDQLIPGNGIACIAGRPKVGKSFTVLELATSIASGEPLFGQFEVDQKNVLIISKEDGVPELKERLEKMNIDPNLNISICTDQHVFFDEDSVLPRLMSLIHRHEAEVVIIDSFIRVYRGDENTSKGITQVHRVFKQLNDEGISVIFIHHHGKEDAQQNRSAGDKLRGSSDILAMIDTLLTVRKENETTLYFSNDENRHARKAMPFYVSFPDFGEDNCRFRFLGFSANSSDQEIQRPIEIAMEQALSLLNEQGTMHQADIVRSLSRATSGSQFGTTTIKNALRRLESMRQVVVINESNRKLYAIPVQVQAEGVEG